MNLTRRGFLSSIVLAYAGARKAVKKKVSTAFFHPRQQYLYSQDMRVPFFDGSNGLDLTQAHVLERRVLDVEAKHVSDAIPELFGSWGTQRTTKNGQRTGGRRRRQGGRTHGVGVG